MRQAYECHTQQEIVLIKHSDIFISHHLEVQQAKTGESLTNIYLLKLEAGTNQSHNVCAWRVVNMS